MSHSPSNNLPVPSPRQIAWHKLEVYGFLHFTVNTFTDQEWGYGDEAPEMFNPSAFDADQMVSTAKAGGLKGLILTCKHHDGFCLWPSAYTDHSLKSSPWRQGKGDVVRDISAACAREGLKFGVYLSPWDRSRPDYGSAEYLQYFRNQLRELLTNYGPIFEVWFDGANGGDGYYGGAREERRIDKTCYYDWETTWQIVRDLQPEACIFSDVGPDIRWVGNERGIAGEPCWATLTTTGLAPGLADGELLNRGERQGERWLPAECDVSIRPGWFYHANEDAQVKSPEELVELYYHSVGRGASLLLNLPPDRRGRIHENDARALLQFNDFLRRTFQDDLARRGTASAAAATTNPQLSTSHVNDGDAQTFWSPADGALTTEVVLEFANPLTFNVISLREYIPLGQRVDGFACDVWDGQNWAAVYEGQSIGSRRLIRTAETTTQRVRLRVLSAAAPAAISEFALFHAPGQ